MKRKIFIAILILFLPMFLYAQDNITQDNKTRDNNAQGNNLNGNIKKEVNKYLTMKINSLADLNSKLVDEYGLNKLRFLKLENGTYVPLTPTEGKDISEIMVSQEVIVIFAIIGAVLIGLILLRAL